MDREMSSDISILIFQNVDAMTAVYMYFLFKLPSSR